MRPAVRTRNPRTHIDSCLDAMAGARWFSTFDLRVGYHQVKMDPASAEKMTFITNEGTFKFKIMPFELARALAIFQQLMDLFMARVNLEICLVNLHNISLLVRGT